MTMLHNFITGIFLLNFLSKISAQENIIITKASEASPVTLNCSGSVGSYSWLYNGVTEAEASNSSTYQIIDSRKVGEYKCMGVSNVTYEATNFTAPVIGHGEKSITVTEGDVDITLTCTSYSSPTPAFYWMVKKDDKAPVNLSDSSSPQYKIKNNGTSSLLTIVSVTMESRANYECNADNSVGTKNTTILVRVQGRLAPLWPFLGIVAEVVIMAIITLIFSRRSKEKQKKGNPAPTESASRNNEAHGSGIQRNDAKED